MSELLIVVTCPDCGGQGIIEAGLPGDPVWHNCDRCDASGTIAVIPADPAALTAPIRDALVAYNRMRSHGPAVAPEAIDNLAVLIARGLATGGAS